MTFMRAHAQGAQRFRKGSAKKPSNCNTRYFNLLFKVSFKTRVDRIYESQTPRNRNFLRYLR